MDIEYSDLNPKSILLNYTLGPKTASISFAAVDAAQNKAVQRAILRGASIGSCGVLMIVLAIINSSKRKTPMYYLNMTTSAAAIVRNALYVAYLLNPLAAPSFSLTGLVDPSDIGNYRMTVASNAFQVILILLVEVTMTYQVFVVFRTPDMLRWAWAVAGGAGTLGAAVVGLYINNTVQSARIYQSLYTHDKIPETSRKSWVTSLPNILFAVSVNLLCVILLIKLGMAIRTRRRLGLKQFDGFHVLFIMATQTMIIPSIVTVVSYIYSDYQGSMLISTAIQLVVLSLPLSSFWASVANNDPNPTHTTYSFLNKTMSSDSYGSRATDGMTLTNVSFLREKYSGKAPDVGKYDSSENPYAEPTSASTSDYDLEVPGSLTPQDEGLLGNVNDGDFIAISTHQIK